MSNSLNFLNEFIVFQVKEMFRPDPTEEGNGMVKEQKEDVTKCFKPKTVSVVVWCSLKKFLCGFPSLMNTPPDVKS